MDNVEKLRVMLQHWIEHNKGHVEEFEKWRATMTADGRATLAAQISRAVELMGQVNAELGKALDEAGGSKPDGGHHHHNDGGHHHHNDGGHHHHHH